VWREIDLGAARGEGPRFVFPRPGGGVDLATEAGVWTIPRRGAPRRLASVRRVEDVLSLPDGRRFVLTFYSDAYLLRGDTLRQVLEVPGRGIDLAARGEAVWVAYDRYLARLLPGRTPEVMGPDDGLEAGGPLLVDAERSLWLGSYEGLLQLPEPETVVWSDPHGLPSSHTRFVERAGDRVWVATWQGVGWIETGGSRWEADTLEALFTRSRAVVDGDGDLWMGTARGLAEFRPGRKPVLHEPDLTSVAAADRGEDGTMWMGGVGGVYRVETAGYGVSDDPGVERVRGLEVPEEERATAVLRDREGWLWVGVGERICRAAVDDVVAGEDPAWTCWAFPGADHFNAFHRTPSGSLWAASPHAGLLRRRDGRWEPLPGASELPSRSVLNLVPSPEGGVWVLGHGILRRVVPEPRTPEGWRVVERLSSWHGLPATGGRDLLEDPDGTLWITTSRGLVRVPARVRRESPSPPPVSLVEARADDRRLDLDRSAELPHRRNRLELRFAALSYRAPSRVRYQVRLHSGSEWSETRFQPVVRWVDLRPGSYRAEVRASLDGTDWSLNPASFAFEVLPPWYLEPRWIVVFVLAGVLVGLLAYRARVAHVVGLERQRTRIAMDLHDELGAALGSIGIQAGMLRRQRVIESQRRRLAGEISDTAEALGTVLADIVWSLDPRPATLDDLALRLEERGRRLFGEEGTEFRVRSPRTWPSEDLPASVRRNVLLVGLEALKNAAEHADADRVSVSLGPARHGLWRLTVADDGRGISPSDVGEGDGMGLLSMRKRAAEIGADIAWRRPGAGGTEVVLTFPLRGRTSLVRRIRAWRSRE
jgi:signal transduction histidine kinase